MTAYAEKREPLFHLSRRTNLPWWRAWLMRAGAIVAALLFCALLCVLVTGTSPLQIGSAVFDASFKSPRKTWVMLHSTSILLCISLAVTPAFRMRFWNVGGEGQALMGCLASAACMILLRGKMSSGMVILCSLLASILMGGLWGMIPAFFKARWSTNETLFTLMMNYIATQLVAFFCVVWESPKGSGQIGIINQRAPFEGVGWLPEVWPPFLQNLMPGGQKYLLNILIVAALCVAMFFYLNYSKHGFELSVVGESERTAHYLGIKVGRVIIRTMLFSGALCGLTGFLLTAGNDHTLTTTLIDGRGFTAVMVSWLAKFNPLWMILTSFLLVFLDRGAGEISTQFGLNESFSDILTGVILFFIIGSEFLIRYRISLRHRHKGGEDLG
ncbi:MAG: ABC transporter permease [Clostridia bacterium]|nr:ABC transporter permease [Clostridia bacterium]